MPDLRLGPVLRHVGERHATVWVETDGPCEVEVLGRRSRTFCVAGHHYAIVVVDGLAPGGRHPYAVRLDGEVRFEGAAIRTLAPGRPLRIAFGSCRCAVPHEEPYTLSKDEDPLGREVDALAALAQRLRSDPDAHWPDLLLMLGDQVYADEDAPRTRAFIRARRDTSRPPGEGVADFEEYTRLYWESWGDPPLRWLLANVPTAMIFDDHDVHDDWNTSQAWLEEMERQPWWHERIEGALMSYWLYQHLGNLPPDELAASEVLRELREEEDGADRLRRFAREWDHARNGSRWSHARTLPGGVRLVVMDSREGRTLTEGDRKMFDEAEWDWLRSQLAGGCEHLLLADTLPVLMPVALHHLEAWNEAVCAGAWGRIGQRLLGERVRRGLDLEHWGAFRRGFEQLATLLLEVGRGDHGPPPRTITLLAGDIHHAYLAQVGVPRDAGVRSVIHQAVCSPFRNPLNRSERAVARVGSSRTAAVAGRALARSAGVPDPPLRWRLAEPPTFDNQVATLTFDGPQVRLAIERTRPGTWPEAPLEAHLDRRLA